MDIWEVGTLNQLFVRDSYTETTFSKIKRLVAKLRSLWSVHFVLQIIFALIEFDRVILHGNVAFSIIMVLSSTISTPQLPIYYIQY